MQSAAGTDALQRQAESRKQPKPTVASSTSLGCRLHYRIAGLQQEGGGLTGSRGRAERTEDRVFMNGLRLCLGSKSYSRTCPVWHKGGWWVEACCLLCLLHHLKAVGG